MSYIILYRKPKFHSYWPWQEACHTTQQAIDFIESLDLEFIEFRVFQEIDFSDLLEIAEDS